MKAFSLSLTLCFGLTCLQPVQAFDLNHGDEILVQFDTTSISRAQFEVDYQAWLDLDPTLDRHLPENYSQFLSLAIRLKQLVLVAKDRGINQQENFKSKLSQLLESARENGQLNRDIANWKLHEAYYRQQYLVNASHLLIVGQAHVTDPQALDKILQIRKDLLARPGDFGEFARLHSDDPSALSNNGQLGYFTVFDQIYPLESAAYKTPARTISKPVKSRFGYHLVKVNSRDKIDGIKRASHIFIKTSASNESDESETAKTRINRIYNELTVENFTEKATSVSEDYKTSVKGGDLGTDRLIDDLESIKLTLPPGVISRPFKSPLGWHIVMITEVQAFPSFLEMRQQLRQKINLDARIQREIDLITGNDKPAKITSPVFNAYLEDLLCRMLLARSAISATELSSRAELIDLLKTGDLPPDLSDSMSEYPASVNRDVLRSIFD